MKVLVTGSSGFIGKNISLWLKNNNHEVLSYDRDTTTNIIDLVKEANYIIHLAGINRPLTTDEFYDGNINFTKLLVDTVKQYNPKCPIIFSSSIQAELDNDYGKSKKQAEDYLFNSGLTVYVYRLCNVFGKWCKPNYNSVVATFCYNITRDIPININNKDTVLRLNYIDDICDEFIKLINGDLIKSTNDINYVNPIHQCSLGHLVDLLKSFVDNRKTFKCPCFEDEFVKDLYATWLSYLPSDEFSYPLNSHIDNRGSFTEILKTDTYGQVSVNIIKSGITKGNHYHNTKNEKFLVVSGKCSIKFRDINTNNVIEYIVSGDKLEVVDIPCGYTHNITNIGDSDSAVIMWANEEFNVDNLDTFEEEV